MLLVMVVPGLREDSREQDTLSAGNERLWPARDDFPTPAVNH
jgi:hypothetical protein